MNKTLFYELYPSSWEHLGGFRGMTKFLDILKRLDVDYVWVAPCYPSPWSDGGYDISDYKAINSRFGTMEDFDKFVSYAKELGIGVLMDLVLNHTSTEHLWFKKSLAGVEPYKDYYCWQNWDLRWGNMFNGGSAFEWSHERKQYYLHLFNKFQADLNWDNPALIDEFDQVIDFWTKEHGVSGFRLDVPQFIGKTMLPSFLPKSTGVVRGFMFHYMNPKTLDVLHQLFDGRDIMTVGECAAPFSFIIKKMTGKDGPLKMAFNTLVLESIDKIWTVVDVEPSYKRFLKNFKKWSKISGYVATMESHDTPRFTSRSGETWRRLLGDLFNSDVEAVCLYQGQELGLRNPRLSDKIESYQDSQAIMRYEIAIKNDKDLEKTMQRLRTQSRDNARVPFDLSFYKSRGHYFYYTKEIIKNWKSR